MRYMDIFLLLVTLFSLVWPWAFFGTLLAIGGVPLPCQLADYVVLNPQLFSAFATFVGTVYQIVSASLFGGVVKRFAQEWVRERERAKRPVSVFTISTLLSFRYQTFMWELTEIESWKVKWGWVWILLLGTWTIGFALMPTGIVALLTPGPYIARLSMAGVEVDLTMRGSECEQWWTLAQLANPDCTSKPTGDPAYTTRCLGTTANDALSAAVANMLHLKENNTEPSSLTMIGREKVLHFLGPTRGVLPMGPDGSPAFDLSRLSLDPFSANHGRCMRSYAYTLQQQGLSAGTTCTYDSHSPIVFSEAESGGLDIMEYTGSCDSSLGWTGISEPVRIPKGLSKTLGSWACESITDLPAAKSHIIYLSLRTGMDPNMNQVLINITCTIPPLHFGLYDVTFNSSRGHFRVSREPIKVPQATRPGSNESIETPFLDGIVSNTVQFLPLMQNSLSNMLVESVIALGVQIYQLPAAGHSEEHLMLYAAMLNGIMEYFGTAMRAELSSANLPLPEECRHTVRGNVLFEAIGWRAKPGPQVSLLLPLTIVNMVTLWLLIMGASMAWDKEPCSIDPTDVRTLLKIPAESVEWGARVKFHGGTTGPEETAHRPNEERPVSRSSAGSE